MNPYFLTGSIGTSIPLKRVCPKCLCSQIVPFSKRNQSVACNFCGTKVPPTKQLKRRRIIDLQGMDHIDQKNTAT